MFKRLFGYYNDKINTNDIITQVNKQNNCKINEYLIKNLAREEKKQQISFNDQTTFNEKFGYCQNEPQINKDLCNNSPYASILYTINPKLFNSDDKYIFNYETKKQIKKIIKFYTKKHLYNFPNELTNLIAKFYIREIPKNTFFQISKAFFISNRSQNIKSKKFQDILKKEKIRYYQNQEEILILLPISIYKYVSHKYFINNSNKNKIQKDKRKEKLKINDQFKYHIFFLFKELYNISKIQNYIKESFCYTSEIVFLLNIENKSLIYDGVEVTTFFQNYENKGKLYGKQL